MDIYRNSEYLRLNPSWHAEDSAWKAEQIATALGAAGIAPRRVVEIGCGAGGILRQLVSLLPSIEHAVGYDISEQALALARQQPDPRVAYAHGDIAAISDFYDVALAIDVIEHVEDYIGFLRQLRSTGRSFVLHIPLDMHVSGLLRNNQLRVRQRLGHLHYFSKSTALATLTDCGYRIIFHQYTRGALELRSASRGIYTRLANGARRLTEAASADLAATILGGYSLLVVCAAD